MHQKEDQLVSLHGRRILVVEDEVLLAMELESLLTRQGCVVLGPVPTVRRAEALLDRETPDAAFLDLNLNGEVSTPLAVTLTDREVPFIILSGYGEDRLGEPVLQAAPHVGKPCSEEEIIRQLREVLRSQE